MVHCGRGTIAILGFFFLVVLAVLFLRRGGGVGKGARHWALGYHSIGFRHFPNIS